jgi:DNA-binding NarL/FixJ family response regulator
MSRVQPAIVFIADAEPVARHGLATLLNAHAAFRVAAQADSVRALRALCARQRPALLVLDPAMDAGEGFAFLRELPRWAPRARVVAFTSAEDAASVQRAFRLGVRGYVTRRDALENILAALAGALADERHVSPRIERVLLEHLARGTVELGAQLERTLSVRELQIYRLLGQGRAAREMAAALGLSVKTIESLQQRMKEKLGLKSGSALRQQAALYVGTP